MIGNTARVLHTQKLNGLIADLSTMRVDTFIRELEKYKSKGRILPFVRGLRLSAILIYEIREILSGSNLKVDWGHLMDEDGELCSPECDIIIYNGNYFKRWNGGQDPVMDFKFIFNTHATAVISCKSYLRTSEIEKEYCVNMLKHVEKVWLFSECCGPRSFEKINSAALEIGYENFWHLYTWNRVTGDTKANVDGWIDFRQKVEDLASS